MNVFRASVIAMLLLAIVAPAPGARRRTSIAVPIKPVGLLDWGGSMYTKGLFDGETRTNRNVKTTSEQRLFEEGVELTGKGYFYHPNLAEWFASIRAGLSQELITVNDTEHKTNGTLLGYNFSNTFLKEKLVSVRVFANQNQSIRDQNFAASARAENQRLGAEVTLKGLFPASLLVETGTNTEESERRALDSSVMHVNFIVADKRYPDWLTEFEFDREDVDETSTFFNSGQTTGIDVDQSEVIDDAKISNLWLFGPGQDKHSLTGSFGIMNRTGFSPNKRISGEQQLDLLHNKTLRSFYRARFSNEKGELQSEDIIDGELGVVKQFYKSLDITLRTTGRKETIDKDEEEEIIGGFLEADYRKKTPIGLYTSTLLLGRERETQTSQGDLRLNQDRRITLGGLTFSPLTSANVVDSSIVVTDTDDSRPAYIRGIDYQIRKTGQLTEISRLGGGIITDGQTVLVDYFTEGTGDLTFNTDHFRWRQNMALKHLPLSLYTNYTLRDDTLQAGNDPGNLDSARVFLVGTELDWKGLRVAVERENRESLISTPSLTHRARASYIRPIGRNSKFSLGARIEKRVYSQAAEFELEDGEDKLDTVGANVYFTTKIGANTLLDLKSIYLKSEGRENNMLFTNGFSLQWQYGKVDLSVDGTYDVYEQEDITGTAFNLMFYLKRKF